MAYYTEPTINDTEDLFTLFKYVNNTASDGLFFPIMLLVIFVMTWIGSVFAGKEAYRGFTYAGFFCSILSIMLVLMDVLNKQYMYFLFFLTGIGLIWVRLAEAQN